MRLNHVTLTVTDVERSADFYRRLGLRQIVASYPHYARFVSPEGDTTLSLHDSGNAAAASPAGASIHFECDDVDATVSTLKRQGFSFELDPTDQPYLWREAVLHDPDGNPIFLFSAGENRLDPPWRIDGD